MKHKPKATGEQLKTVMGEFSAFLEKCCKADDKEACFSEEVTERFAFCCIQFPFLCIWSGQGLETLMLSNVLNLDCVRCRAGTQADLRSS